MIELFTEITSVSKNCFENNITPVQKYIVELLTDTETQVLINGLYKYFLIIGEHFFCICIVHHLFST